MYVNVPPRFGSSSASAVRVPTAPKDIARSIGLIITNIPSLKRCGKTRNVVIPGPALKGRPGTTAEFLRTPVKESSIEPNRSQILIDVMAGADFPAFDIGA